MSEIEQRLRNAADRTIEEGIQICEVKRATVLEAADDLARLRVENQIRAQEYAILLGLWKETSERAEEAEAVFEVARGIINTRASDRYDWLPFVLALAQYDSHADRRKPHDAAR